MALTEKQLEARKQGIGGSDAAAVAGVSPWATPLDVWYEKTGQALAQHDEEALERMHFGDVLEPIIADEFVRRNGMVVRRANATLVHPAHPFMLCHLDRRIVGGGILECKATGSTVEEPVEAHQVQVLHQLAVTGATFGVIAYLCGGNKYVQFSIERDDEAIEALIRIESAFWRHVQNRTPPAPITLSDVARLYPKDNGAAVVAPDGIAASCYRLAAFKAQAKDVDAQIEAEELAIKAAMGEATTLMGPDGRTLATWKTQQARRFDSATFKAERPEEYAAYTKETTSRVLRLKTKENA